MYRRCIMRARLRRVVRNSGAMSDKSAWRRSRSCNAVDADRPEPIPTGSRVDAESARECRERKK
jgi:hypothetical protein